MPSNPKTISTTTVGEGKDATIVVEQYTQPFAGDGVLAVDEYAEFDLWRARQMMGLLQQVYPGHRWWTFCDTKQGVAYISIPVLMGREMAFAINLKKNELTIGMVSQAGGEILERYGLPVGPFNLDSFLAARNKFGKLHAPWRKVPN